MRTIILFAALSAACSSSSSATKLERTLAARYAGDRTGACIAAAVIDGDDVERASLCADPAHPRPTDGAFEIGSVSKTMSASVLATLIDQGVLALADPIAQHLPPGTQVPTFDGAPIRLAHLVTHTSGLPPLPSRLVPTNPDDPYAALTTADLLASLGDVTLTHAPGAQWAYSNFGGMVLSDIVSRAAGSDFETAARSRLFAPLGMDHTYVDHAPAGVTAALGHRETGEPTAAWHFAPELVGVGGVRATLDDMVRYAQAELGRGDARTVELLARTHAAVDLGQPRPPGDPEMAMGWVRLRLADRTVLVHDGATGGFTSFVAFDPDTDRAIVLLADTELVNTDGLADLAFHLLDPQQPLSGPRTIVTPPAPLLAALAGRYEVLGLSITLRADAGALVAAFDGDERRLAYDSHGDFFSREIPALLTPVRGEHGEQTFKLVQSGVPTLATRLPDAFGP